MITPKAFLAAGVSQQTDYDFNQNEALTFEQYQRQDTFGKVILVNRTRLEQRYDLNDPKIANRLRHQIRTMISADPHNRWKIIFFDEIFLGLNTNNTTQTHVGLTQNRFYAGLRRNSKSANFYFEVGYLNQTVFGASPSMLHLPTITVGKIINIKKKSRSVNPTTKPFMNPFQY